MLLERSSRNPIVDVSDFLILCRAPLISDRKVGHAAIILSVLPLLPRFGQTFYHLIEFLGKNPDFVLSIYINSGR